jgi:cell volume regulation protein A
MPIEHVMVGIAGLLLASVIASKASGRFGVPALLVFLVVGMLAGSDGPGGIDFDYPRAAQSLGIGALAFILFAGGLDTRWVNIRPILVPSLILSTAGVLATAVLVAFCTKAVLGMGFAEAMLLGSIVSSTDAAAVFGILRSKHINLQTRLRSLLEFESGSNDPMAVFLTLGVIALITRPDFGAARFGVMFVQQMTLGAALGFGMGRGMVFAVNRLKLQYEGLYPAVTVALVLFTYGAAAVIGGNGFLAVYAAAIVMGNSDFLHKRSLMRFHDGLAWLMQIVMFLTLGLQVFPSRLLPVMPAALVIALFLMFIARPTAVLILLLGSAVTWRERLLISWVGLRGAAPIVLATFPLIAGIPSSGLIFHVVFFIVLTSGILQGTSVGWLAHRLGLADSSRESTIDPLELISSGDRDISEFFVAADSPVRDRRIVDIQFPANTIVLLIDRNGTYIIPRGSTTLQVGDRMLILAAKPEFDAVEKVLGDA